MTKRILLLAVSFLAATDVAIAVAGGDVLRALADIAAVAVFWIAMGFLAAAMESPL